MHDRVACLVLVEGQIGFQRISVVFAGACNIDEVIHPERAEFVDVAERSFRVVFLNLRRRRVETAKVRLRFVFAVDLKLGLDGVGLSVPARAFGYFPRVRRKFRFGTLDVGDIVERVLNLVADYENQFGRRGLVFAG